ncbi:MAG: molybdopterin-dependent oxidoreductase [Pseudonocardia sp.]|nr:molybdopterin-dependent oxidoreductase [Pseudonocardia sp.]
MSTTAAPPEQSTDRPRARRIPRALAALIGVLAVGAALGVGHLVAAVAAPSSSPFLAVGDTVIRFSPQWLTEFAKTTFGTADKPILLAGMGVVILLIAASAGALSRRRATVGLAVVVAMGVLGLLAVAFSPAFGLLSLLAPLASIVVGVVSFRWLHGLALRTYAPAATSGGVSRRGVLIGSAAAVGVGALAAGAGGVVLGGNVEDARRRVTARLARARLAEVAPPVPATAAFTESGTVPFITSNAEFYRVDTALRLPTQSETSWSCEIGGMVDNPFTLTFDDLMSRPLVERTLTMTCVSNVVGGPYISTANFIGVELRDILAEAGVQPGADQVLSTSLDRWTAGSPTDVVMDPARGALMVVGMNGEALPAEHGFPVRLVVPGLYGFLSATKWLTDIELTTFGAAQGYWLQRGWGRFAPIKTQCRIESPIGFDQVPAGTVTVAGIAWSQPVGISRVEVRMDGGPWQEAELAEEVNPSTWRMWRTDFDLTPGSHTVQSRATDGNGVTQPEESTPPIPDGAQGWPGTIFTVA